MNASVEIGRGRPETQRIGRRLAHVAASILLSFALFTLAGCEQGAPKTLELSGNVLSETVDILAPALPSSSPDMEAGFARTGEGTPSILPPERPEEPGGATAQPETTAWMRVARVLVSPGEEVLLGQELLLLDSSMLDAEVQQAEAAVALADAMAAMAGSRSREASEGITDIEEQRAEIATQTAELQRQRTELQLQLDQARAIQGSPGATGTPDVSGTIRQLEGSIAEIDAALEDLGDAMAELNKASAELNEAKTALEALRDGLEATADARRASAAIARAKRARASVTAPVEGVVISTVPTGSVVAANAPLVVVRPHGPVMVRTYVTAAQRELITRGSSARVTADSMPGQVLAGAVVSVGSDYEYVPTSFATKIIHLVRGLEVEVLVYGNRAPPPGTPVDISIDTVASASQ